jgi:isoquinoline 1-oxidoreductase subunit beta
MIVQPLSKLPASRRQFLAGAAIGGTALVIGTHLPLAGKGALAEEAPIVPNAFVKIAPDSTVTVIIKHLDKGQGVTTGLSTIVAEELDADWAQMRTEFAPADAKLYNNLVFGTLQATGGSTSIANSWTQLRRAAAASRQMLIAAAAEAWNVPATEITIEKGVLKHAKSGKSASFGEFAERAAKEPVPQDVKLKDPKDFKLIGVEADKRVPRIDSIDKTTGKAIYALDVRRPGMVTAVIARPPRFGGVVKNVDATAAKAIKDVVDVVTIPQGVVVLARDTWPAIQGREALKIAWDDSQAETRSSPALFADYKKLAETPGILAAKTGDTETAFKGAATVIEAEFNFPYLAHAPMEPLNCTIEMQKDGGCEIWAGSQFQTIEQAVAAAVLGLKPEQVKINTVWAGGSFGRRATPNADYIAEAAAILKATGGKAPVHLVWTREDDLTGGRYRPMFYHKVKAALNAGGDLVAWQHRLVGQSFVMGTPFEGALVKNGVDVLAVEGVADMPYRVPNLMVDWHNPQSPVTTLWWRSVGHTHTAQAVEVMIDELAVAAHKDPLQFRLGLLPPGSREVGVLKLAAEKAGWGSPLPSGKGRGIAVHKSFGTYVGSVAEVTANKRDVKVDRIVAAVDCGVAITPDVIRAQIEGGTGYALGAALRDQITLKNGVVEQTNFDGYEPLRISDMPKVEVHIVTSNEPPSGVGEPGVPPVAPAVTNAIFAATGKRLRSLPWDFGALGSS